MTYYEMIAKKKKCPIVNFYVAAAAVLSNLKRIEVTYQPTTVTGAHGDNNKVTYANYHQNGPQTRFRSNHCRIYHQFSKLLRAG